MSESDRWDHLLVVVEALVASGNVAVDGGFVANQGGWDCLMRDRLDFDVAVPLLQRDAHDVRVDRDKDRIDCLHCWSSILGLGAI